MSFLYEITDCYPDSDYDLESSDSDSDSDSDLENPVTLRPRVHFETSDEDEDSRTPSPELINAVDTSISSAGEFEGWEGDPESVSLPKEVGDDFRMQDWVVGGRPKVDLPFKAEVGLRMYAIDENAEPIDFMRLFLHEDYYRTMAVETNRYAKQILKNKVIKQHSRFNSWTETTPGEMRMFIAMIYAMGLVIKRDISEYWSVNCVTATPFFPSCMPRDQFWLLMSFFHLSDNDTAPAKGEFAYNPVNKLGHIYKNVIHCFNSVYKPSQFLSLDEGMVPWRGNLGFRVYQPDKPKKYGMKAYMLCDSSNGYCMKFELYTGKVDKKKVEVGITYDLVMRLMKEFRSKGHHLFMDNYYTSPTLFANLWKLDIGATGTLRSSRKGVPKALISSKPKKGETVVMHNKNMLAMKYHDRKIVYLLTTVESADDIPTGKMCKKTRQPVI